jgi:hypothetical protein
MTRKPSPSMMISPSDGPRCTCCGSVHEPPSCITTDEGWQFCSERCYQAWVENLTEYLEAARAGRHYFEKPTGRGCTEPTTILTPEFWKRINDRIERDSQ